MSNAGHTAGPASVYDSNNTLAVCIGEVPTGKRPCIIDWPGFDSCDLPFDEQRANARFIAEAFTVAHETGLTPRQLADRCEKLEAALKFYADRRRYDGANQKPIDGDCYAPANAAYMQDVTRDGGQIARAALAKAEPGKLTDDEIVELTSREAALGPDKAGGA